MERRVLKILYKPVTRFHDYPSLQNGETDLSEGGALMEPRQGRPYFQNSENAWRNCLRKCFLKKLLDSNDKITYYTSTQSQAIHYAKINKITEIKCLNCGFVLDSSSLSNPGNAVIGPQNWTWATGPDNRTLMRAQVLKLMITVLLHIHSAILVFSECRHPNINSFNKTQLEKARNFANQHQITLTRIGPRFQLIYPGCLIAWNWYRSCQWNDVPFWLSMFWPAQTYWCKLWQNSSVFRIQTHFPLVTKVSSRYCSRIFTNYYHKAK